MPENASPEKWLPIGISFKPTEVSVRWLDFGSKTICEPFFNQTVKNVRPAQQRVTNASTLLEVASRFPVIRPAGIIFHVSRCGSTFLANALRLGSRTVVMSEAHSIGMFFRHDIFRNSPMPVETWEDSRKQFANAIATLYAHYAGDTDPRLVIKTHAIGMLQIQTVRSIWPDVPCVILIRDPVEVMVSNLSNPAAWLRTPLPTGAVFGWTMRDVQVMTSEEYCARGIGRFCEAAFNQLDDNCEVIDYADLDVSAVHRIAARFNIDLSPDPDARWSQVLEAYSKDPTGTRTFARDHERKQSEITESGRRLAARWAQPHYEELKQFAHGRQRPALQMVC